jgi:hypothetical protein
MKEISITPSVCRRVRLSTLYFSPNKFLSPTLVTSLSCTQNGLTGGPEMLNTARYFPSMGGPCPKPLLALLLYQPETVGI